MDGHTVRGFESVSDAWDAIVQNEPNALLTDVNLPDGNGIDLLKRVREREMSCAVIVLTAYGSVENAVEAMRAGADDYLEKPVALDELTLVVERRIQDTRTRAKVRIFERMERLRSGVQSGPIGESAAWQNAVTLAERFANVPVPGKGENDACPAILVLGETGSGKGEIARLIHRASPEAASTDEPPFVHVNCAALPPTLVESELFGHEKGAFTDAKSSRKGLFELAEGGTIFLDEIGELSPGIQAKLLLVVEDGLYRPVGSVTERRVRTRLIAATNQRLDERVERGEFREDLLYRLNALTIRVPPLREREDDALLIARVLLDRAAESRGVVPFTLTEDAKHAIRNYPWRGNVRELINVIKRISIVCHGTELTAADFDLGDIRPRESPNAAVVSTLSENGTLPTLEDMERHLIEEALKNASGNISAAANSIGLNRGALRYRIDRLGIKASGVGGLS